MKILALILLALVNELSGIVIGMELYEKLGTRDEKET